MDKIRILQGMSEIQAIAENEDTGLKNFLPLKSYEMLGDPNKFVIVGGRGTGKTRLFKTLQEKEGFRQILGDRTLLFQPNADNSKFMIGYDQTNPMFPSGAVMESIVKDGNEEIYWKGSIIFLLLSYAGETSEIQRLFYQYFDEKSYTIMNDLSNLKRLSKWILLIKENLENCECFLDDVDLYLKETEQWIFFTYDSLDRICPKYIEWFPFIRTLLAFWFNHLHRWKRLKCKVFLRNDLYESDKLAFPDSSKIKVNTLFLEWDTLSLYRLLLKRMANSGCAEVMEYLRRIPELIGEKPKEELGYIPTEQEETIKRFVNEMIGEYMGKDAKKGLSYSWVPNHLQDTHGVLAPRSFLKCFSVAASRMYEKMIEGEQLDDTKILSPSMIQGAVQDVSEDRVAELQEEYTWLKRLKTAFNGATMLMERREFIQRIRMDLWNDSEKEELPATNSEGIFDMLEKLGIVFIARDGRVNVPEIYLHGFGMKRKGGLRRPR